MTQYRGIKQILLFQLREKFKKLTFYFKYYIIKSKEKNLTQKAQKIQFLIVCY